MKKIIITGSSGYIGSYVLHKLVELNYDIYAIIRRNSKLDLLNDVKGKINFILYNESLNNLIEQFSIIKADVVIHIASLFIAEHNSEDVEQLIDSNIKFSSYILEAMYYTGVRNFINTSTSWEHYNNEQYNPVCLYAATKRAFEDIIKYYVKAKGINAITLTIYDTYGPDDPRNKIMNLFKRIAETGEKLDMSNGEQYLDLIYIDDIVRAYVISLNMLLEKFVQGINKFYLRSGNEMCLRDIAELYSQINHVKLNINWGKRPYRGREVMETYKGGTILPDWEPNVTLAEGLKKLNEKEKKE